MTPMKVSKAEGWKPVFETDETTQILVNNTGGGRLRLTVAQEEQGTDSYRGRDLGYGDIPAFFMIPVGWKLWGRTNRLSEWATLESEHYSTPGEIEAIISQLRADMQQQTTEDNTELVAMINNEISKRSVALAAEIIARNDAITSAVNAEAAIRAYADTQEGQARIAADAALALRATALETGRVRKYAETIGNGILTTFTINHGLNTRDVVVQCFSASSFGLITPNSIVATTLNSVTIGFILAVGLNGIRVAVVG